MLFLLNIIFLIRFIHNETGTIGKELLPAQIDNSHDCKSSGRTKCFKAGDIR